jgi:hypothetical protein
LDVTLIGAKFANTFEESHFGKPQAGAAEPADAPAGSFVRARVQKRLTGSSHTFSCCANVLRSDRP